MQLYNGELKEHDYNITIKKTKAHRKGEKTKITKLCNDIFTFDIEVSSAWIDNGKIIKYESGKSSDYWNSLIPLALPYIWQFSINEKVYYGREFSDFKQVLRNFPKDVKVIIWVHNLSYEFQFLSNLFKWGNIFARSPHKPIKASPEPFPNIEFRCSYFLTRLSLDTWGKQLGEKKKIGYLNYEEIRTPLTHLTDKEMEYCEGDCKVLYKGICTYVNRYGSIWDIPLTQTGTVRREVKARLTENPEYVKFIKKLIPKNTEEYKMLMDLFAGGYTHANRAHSGIVQNGLIEHYDFASSYPTVMIAEKYPMSPWIYTGLHELPDISEFNKYAFCILAEFRQLKCNHFNTYIQASKCRNAVNCKFDNGRIISADKITIWITEQDYLTISETYDYEYFNILELWKSKKDYLPIKLSEYILELYENKTSLKDVEGMEEIYLQSKQYINSLFGMMVTAIVQADVSYDMENEKWEINKLEESYVQDRLDKLRDWNPRERRYFLSYSWGVWVTAYARRNLWKCIEKVDSEVIYCDTDSIFVLGEHNFNWYNEEITKKIKEACTANSLDYDKTRPKTPKGKEKPLGIFEKEDDCVEFITLGAKRYVERRTDGKLYLTVSGINKDAVALLHNDIENFRDGFNFDKDSIDYNGKEVLIDKDGMQQRAVKKSIGVYLSEMPTVTYPDGYISNYRYGINMRRNGYKLTMTDEYKKLINYMNIDIGEFAETFINKLRGRF